MNLEQYTKAFCESEFGTTPNRSCYRPKRVLSHCQPRRTKLTSKAGEVLPQQWWTTKIVCIILHKQFAVEHLLERSLEPALDDHLARIDALETDQEKSEAFFDFMIADIINGVRHFLVAAVNKSSEKILFLPR